MSNGRQMRLVRPLPSIEQMRRARDMYVPHGLLPWWAPITNSLEVYPIEPGEDCGAHEPVAGEWGFYGWRAPGES
jgi:hypothetical protein